MRLGSYASQCTSLIWWQVEGFVRAEKLVHVPEDGVVGWLRAKPNKRIDSAGVQGCSVWALHQLPVAFVLISLRNTMNVL